MAAHSHDWQVGSGCWRRSLLFPKWASSQSCMSVLITRWLASSNGSDPRQNKVEMTISFMTQPQKKAVTSIESYSSHRSALLSEGGEYTRVWIPRGEDHCGGGQFEDYLLQHLKSFILETHSVIFRTGAVWSIMYIGLLNMYSTLFSMQMMKDIQTIIFPRVLCSYSLRSD